MKAFFLLVLCTYFTSFSQANSQLDSLLLIAKNSHYELNDRIEAYKNISKYFYHRSLDSGLVFIDEGLELAVASKDFSYINGMYKAKSKLYSQAYMRDEALFNMKLALEVAYQSNNDSLVTESLYDMGYLFAVEGDLDSSIKCMEQCSLLAEETQHYDALFRANNFAGNMLIRQGKTEEAKKQYLDAQEANKILNNPEYEAQLNINFGLYYDYLADYGKAMLHYDDALAYYIPNNDVKNLKILYGNIAGVQIELKQYRAAINNTIKALKINHEMGSINGEAWNYNSLGITYNYLHETDSALLCHQKSLALKKSINDSTHLGIIYNSIADVYVNSNQLKKAEEALSKTIAISLIHPDPPVDTYAYMILGEINIRQRYDKGIAYFQKALDMAEEYDMDFIRVDAYNYLYLYFKEVEKFDEAFFYYEKFNELNEKIFGEELKRAVQEIETKHQVAQKDNDIKLLQKTQEIKALQLKKTQEESLANLQITILIFSTILLIGIVIFFYIRQKQHNKVSEIEKRNLKIETDKLRSQINPHFIFNSLNSIQSFISGNATIDAERYLSKFARLMRLILENSRKSFIDFESELETLKLYLELEQLRFNHQFKYEINTNDIDEEFTQIPPMLAQPHIENAILHGVRTIANGLITINYEQVGEKIRCIIDDNGIGREKAAELKSLKTGQKKSLGIQVTHERIALLSEEHHLDLSVEVIDKKDAKNESLGTQIILEMPWKE